MKNEQKQSTGIQKYIKSPGLPRWSSGEESTLMQGTPVPLLVWEDPACRSATAPCARLLSRHSRACKLQLPIPRTAATEAHVPRAESQKRSHCDEESVKSSPRSQRLEKSLRAAMKTRHSQKINQF